MKLIHTSDWLLGSRFHGYYRMEEQAHFLHWLRDLLVEREPDVLLISGDIFDGPVCSDAAETLFYDFLHQAVTDLPGLKVFYASGSHDSPSRLGAFRPLLSDRGIEACAAMECTPKGELLGDLLIFPLAERNQTDAQVLLLVVPRWSSSGSSLASPSLMLRRINELQQLAVRRYGNRLPLLLLSHFLPDEVDCSAFSMPVAYGALGGSHYAQEVSGKGCFHDCGSPWPLSFDEVGATRGVNWVELQGDGVRVEQVEYVPLRSFLTLPETGGATFSEALQLLEKLPKRRGGEPDAGAPYLQLCVSEPHPDASMVDRLLQSVTTRNVRLCRMLSVDADGSRRSYPVSDESLQLPQPALLARSLYQNTYGEEMPDALARLFAMAKRQSSASDAASSPF